MKKTYLIIYILVLSIASFFIFRNILSFPFFHKQGKIQQQGIAASVEHRIDFGDGKPLVTTLQTTTNMNALDALKKAAEQEKIPIEMKTYPFGVLVQSIKNKENSKEKAWILFVNGKAASTSADSYLLHQNDVIEWRYIKSMY